MSWLKKISSKLRKTSSSITQAFTKKRIDEEALEDLHDSLIMADLGVKTSDYIIKKFSKAKFGKDVDEQEIKQALAADIAEILKPYQKEMQYSNQPEVVLVSGVNGNGKTTTIGKLASRDIAAGKKVLLAACDTFRAAAVEQLELWSKRSGAGFISGTKANTQDPASVAYQALEMAVKYGYDVVYLDTAGRLHNNANLMAELDKINRACAKVIEGAPHHTVLVIDATTGQNAMLQVEHFSKVIALSGLIITKLDGTAKAGILVAIASTYSIPIHYIGVGEGIDDLQIFDADHFAKALLGMDE